MGARVTITIENLDKADARLTEIREKAAKNLQTLTEKLAKDAEQEWKQATPRRTGRLQDADRANVGELAFTLENNVTYYQWVDPGHWTPKGWRTKHGYRPAKHRSHVEGRFMTDKAHEFVVDNIEEYLSKFLDGV